MNKRIFWIAAVLLALFCLTGSALAEEARVITHDCSLAVSDGNKKTARMTDGNLATRWQQGNHGEGWVEITAPEGEKIGGVSISFNLVPVPWRVEVFSDHEWVTAFVCENDFLHESVRLESPTEKLRIIAPSKKTKMNICELEVYGPGELPATAQHWEPTYEKADILFLAAHADDELIFFGGGIPTYDTERGYRVVVAYLVNCGYKRQHELLNGLWSMGVRHYPIISPFPDHHTTNAKEAYRLMGGKTKVNHWVVALIRKIRPEVVVTHARGGEYGHGQHQAASRSMMVAWEKAADPTYDTASAETFGVWQIKKLYLHLWKENPIQLDWSQPLASLGGITGLEAADRAFGFHVSQHKSGMDVLHTGTRYDNTAFGLYATTVGPDLIGGDFMENIPVQDGD